MSDTDQWWDERSTTQKFLILVAVLIVGSLLIIIEINEIQFQMSSKDWPTVEGQVVSSQVTFNGDWQDPWWRARVSYVYSVNGISYSSGKIAAGSGTYATEDSAHEVVDRYPRGSTVIVYYDPVSPSTAVLEAGRQSGEDFAVLMLLFGVVIIVLGLVRLVKLIQEVANRSP